MLAILKNICYNRIVKTNRGVVQSVEHQSPKLGVQGSSPCAPARSKKLVISCISRRYKLFFFCFQDRKTP